MKGVDAVAHTASPFYTSGVKDPQELIDPAYKGTTGVLKSLKKNKCVRRRPRRGLPFPLGEEIYAEHFVATNANELSSPRQWLRLSAATPKKLLTSGSSVPPPSAMNIDFA